VESRTPPHNLEAEKSVLGSVLLDNEVYATLEGTLTAELFYKEGHRKVWRALERLFRRGEPMDLVTLAEELRQSGDLEAVGSVPYLIGLAEGVPTAAYAESYANIVREKAVLRDLIGASGRILQSAYEQAAPLEQLLDQAESAVFEISSSKRRSFFEGMPQLVGETFHQINEHFNNPDPVSGLRMGFKELDALTSGLQPSSLNVLAARPSMGKTAFALTIAQNVALREKRTVGIFSLEMSGVQLVTRMLCSEARVDMSRVRSGQLSDRDFQRLADTAGRMSEAKIYIDDHADLTVMELRSRARRLMAEHDLGLVVVDYLQLMSGSHGRQSENRQQEISTISRGLKALARELDVPVLVLSQLSRAVEARPNKRPMLSDLRECVPGDTLVQLADGRRRPIADLVGTTPHVVAVDDRGRLTTVTSDRVWRVGERPTFEVVLASGRRRRSTAGHRWLTYDGWRTLETLRPGDRVALARRVPEPTAAEPWDARLVALLGQLVGDGSYLRGQPLRYTTASVDNDRTVREGAELLGSHVRRYAGRGAWWQLLLSGHGDRWRAAGVGAWLKDLGIFGQRSAQKRLPDAVFRLPNAQVGLLLQHLWATDGCIHVRSSSPDRQRGSHRVYFATSSSGLAEDVAALLLRLGIVARLRSPRSPGQAWQVDVSGGDAQRTFLRNVGGFGPRAAAAARLVHALAAVASRPNRDTLPIEVFDHVRATAAVLGVRQRAMAASRGTSYGGASAFQFAPSRATVASYATVLDDPHLSDVATDDLFWDEIVGIAPAGREEVFDLTVPGPASWLADGVVLHNSGAIEQDADLVMFIYRDEYYDPHSEKQGIAEVILGKQRNGPVGQVDLQFHNAHVRFNDLARSGG
jgi:replicative DNA helicase